MKNLSHCVTSILSGHYIYSIWDHYKGMYVFDKQWLLLSWFFHIISSFAHTFIHYFRITMNWENLGIEQIVWHRNFVIFSLLFLIFSSIHMQWVTKVTHDLVSFLEGLTLSHIIHHRFVIGASICILCTFIPDYKKKNNLRIDVSSYYQRSMHRERDKQNQSRILSLITDVKGR